MTIRLWAWRDEDGAERGGRPKLGARVLGRPDAWCSTAEVLRDPDHATSIVVVEREHRAALRTARRTKR
ncbi:MAG: hypothetical protein ACRDRK_16595 [Pseudonocardia sp.]